MTDLLRVLPDFPVGQFARLIPALEKHAISTSDLVTLDAADIAKRTSLPPLDLKRLCSAVLDALHADLGVLPGPAPEPDPGPHPGQQQAQPRPGSEAGPEPDTESPAAGATAVGQDGARALRNTVASLAAQCQTISTLDPALDRALGGGIPAGYVTEVTGESGTGKTQFLLTLLLAVQLPPPHGLGRPALYITTEAPLSTRRLAQVLATNPLFHRLPAPQRPSLDSIISTATPDLESQDHILSFQVPVEVERRGIGLLVIDSVAANYRAEFERSSRHGSNMGARTAELVKLGMHLRELARRHNLAVVVSNQVADRFSGTTTTTTTTATRASNLHHQSTQESPLASRSRPVNSPRDRHDHDHDRHHHHPSLVLDHQQRWFTGWGDSPSYEPSLSHTSLKTPSLGLVWTTQISARIALFRRPAAAHHHHHHYPPAAGKDGSGTSVVGAGGGAAGTVAGGWRRWMKVVFAPHAGETGPGLEGAVEFEVWMGGLRSRSRSRLSEESVEDGGDAKARDGI